MGAIIEVVKASKASQIGFGVDMCGFIPEAPSVDQRYSQQKFGIPEIGCHSKPSRLVLPLSCGPASLASHGVSHLLDMADQP